MAEQETTKIWKFRLITLAFLHFWVVAVVAVWGFFLLFVFWFFGCLFFVWLVCF